MTRNTHSQWVHAPHGERYHYVKAEENGRVEVPCGASSFDAADVAVVSEPEIDDVSEKCNLCRYLAGEIESNARIY